MRKFGKINVEFWTDEKIRQLSDAGKVLAAYLLSCPHSNAIGCYRLPFGYMSDDLAWELDKIETTLKELMKEDFAFYDYNSKFVFIPRFLKYNPIENPSVGKMCVNLVNAAKHSTVIFPRLIEVLLPFKQRFIIKKKDSSIIDFWQNDWNEALKHTHDTMPNTVSYSITEENITPSNTVPDTVSTPSNESLNTVISASDQANCESIESSTSELEKTEENCAFKQGDDTVSDTVYHTKENEPENEPENDIEKKQHNNTPPLENARMQKIDKEWVQVINVFKDAITEVFGQEKADAVRPWPFATDQSYARRFLEAGADVLFCKQVFLERQQIRKNNNDEPIEQMSYFEKVIPKMLAQIKRLEQQPMKEVTPHANTAETVSYNNRKVQGGGVHDDFTRAATDLLHRRRESGLDS